MFCLFCLFVCFSPNFSKNAKMDLKEEIWKNTRLDYPPAKFERLGGEVGGRAVGESQIWRIGTFILQFSFSPPLDSLLNTLSIHFPAKHNLTHF
mgnify:CR=1 FL=1